MVSKRIGISTFATGLAAVFLAAVPAASAATEVGSNCTGDDAEPGTLAPLAYAPSSPLPLSAPAAGVVTKWKVAVIPYPSNISEKLKVLRPTGVANQFEVIGESGPELVVSGANTFDTRIPVQAGDRFGVFGTPNTIRCPGVAGDEMGSVAGDQSVGQTPTFASSPGEIPAVSATIEADVDGDGFGDETQDGCVRSAGVQGPCPIVEFDSFSLPGKNAFVLLLTTTIEAPVTVTGEVKVPKAPRKKGGRAATTIDLNGGTKTVTAGDIVAFKLKYPKSLREALAALSPRKSAKLTATATTTTSAGDTFTRTAKAKLKGTGG